MKLTRIISVLLAVVLLSITLTSCFGFASAEKPKVWTTMKVNISIKYLIYVDQTTATPVDTDFGVEAYEFEYCVDDTPNPTAIDVIEDCAFIEYDVKTNLTKEDRELKFVGEYTSGSYTYEDVEYTSSWILNVNGKDHEGNMNDYKVKEGDTLIFYLYLINL